MIAGWSTEWIFAFTAGKYNYGLGAIRGRRDQFEQRKPGSYELLPRHHGPHHPGLRRADRGEDDGGDMMGWFSIQVNDHVSEYRAVEEANYKILRRRIEAVPLSDLDKLSREIRMGTGLEYMLAEIADLRRRVEELEAGN